MCNSNINIFSVKKMSPTPQVFAAGFATESIQLPYIHPNWQVSEVIDTVT
jgi:hypothetical protein